MLRNWAARGLRHSGPLNQTRWAAKKRKVVTFKRPSKKQLEPQPQQQQQHAPPSEQPQVPFNNVSKIEDKVISEIRKTSQQKQKEVMDFFFDEKPEIQQPPEVNQPEESKNEDVEEWVRNEQLDPSEQPNYSTEKPVFTEEDIRDMKAFSRIKVAKRKKKRPKTVAAVPEPEPETEPEPEPVVPSKVKRRSRRSAKIARTSEVRQTIITKTDRRRLEAAGDPSTKHMIPRGMMARKRLPEEPGSEEETNEPRYEGINQSDILTMLEEETDHLLEAEGKQAVKLDAAPTDPSAELDDAEAPFLRTRMIPKKGTSTYVGVSYRKPTYKEKKQFQNCFHRLPKELTIHKYIDNKEKVSIIGESFVPQQYDFNIDTWVGVAQDNFQIGEEFVERIIAYCDKEGFPGLTITQRYSLPLVCAGHSAIVSAPTGTGKSMAYIIPAVITALRRKAQTNYVGKMTRPSTLVVVGNSLLSKQITDAFREFSAKHLFKVGWLVSQSLEDSLERIVRQRGCDVLIVTANQLWTIIRGRRDVIDFSNLQHVVIDEPDQVIRKHDSLFTHLRSIIEKHIEIFKDKNKDIIPPTGIRQLTAWSASCNDRTKALIANVHNELVPYDPSSIGSELLSVEVSTHLLNPDINHRMMAVSQRSLRETVFSLFNRNEIRSTSKTLVICFGPEEVFKLGNVLKDLFKIKGNGGEVIMLTGQMQQKEKMGCFKAFQEGGSELVMISTDVASRGLQFDGLDIVLIAGLPQTAEDWVHCVGRVGRGGRSGTAITLVSSGHVTPLPGILAKLKATHLTNSIWTSRTKSAIYTNLSHEHSEQEVIPGEIGQVVKKLDISPEVLNLADRVATSMSLSSFSPTIAKTPSAILDPNHPTMPQKTSYDKAAEKARVRKHAIVSTLRGTYQKTIHRLIASKGYNIQGTWAKPHAGASGQAPEVVHAAHEREVQRNKEALSKYHDQRSSYQQQYRAAQIGKWRSRVGDQGSKVPDFFVPDVLGWSSPTATSTFNHQGRELSVSRHPHTGAPSIRGGTEFPV
eukprot:TRINITY_DN8850_c1_g1_i2.p1 TRINITY_DN8850_c1_g1~~TRINITY_DN8850_c1_g1_i2.p1  ORF type:complete len:1028 (+),score=169.44 TRINITY_DN8850_c1_g1_i2:43-3126(+)